MTTTDRAPVMYRISDVVKLTRLSRSLIYEQIKKGRLRAVKQGRATLVTGVALADYVRLLEDEASHDSATSGGKLWVGAPTAKAQSTRTRTAMPLTYG
jgi:hypothetical protein